MELSPIFLIFSMGEGKKCIFVCGRFSGRGDKLCSRSKKDISSSRGTKFLHFAL